MSDQTPHESESRDIYTRIADIMAAVPYIYKAGTAPKEMGGYAYVKHDDVVAALRPAMLRHGVIMVPTIKSCSMNQVQTGAASGRPCWNCLLEIEVQFVAVGYAGAHGSLTITTFGHSMDYQDKAVGKAVSYGVKFALLKLFALETGDDNERYKLEPADGVRKLGVAEPDAGGEVSLAGQLASVAQAWSGCRPDEAMTNARRMAAASGKIKGKHDALTPAKAEAIIQWAAQMQGSGLSFDEAVTVPL